MNYFLTLPFLKVAVISIVIFISLDFLWLSKIAQKLYLKHLGHLSQIENGRIVFNLPAGVSVQIIIALGFAFFVSLALLVHNSLETAIITGAIAGFVTYATFDLTSLSFIRGFTIFISLIDIAWGMVQGIFSGIYVYFLTKYFSS